MKKVLKLLLALTLILVMAAACSSDQMADETPTGATPTGATPTEATPTESADPTPTGAAPTPPGAGGSPAGGGGSAGGDCSASGLSEDQSQPAGLPAEVAAMRNQILKAAVNCDYQLLEELALKPDGSFQYSLTEESAGPDAKPAEFWRAQERAGNRPLKTLVEILKTNPKVQSVSRREGPGSGSADAYYNWPANPSPETFGGYRTSILSTGDWIFFLKTQ